MMKTNSKKSNAKVLIVTTVGLALLILIVCPKGAIAQATNTFPSSGSVGVGTTSPGEKLDVSGTFRASGQNSAPASGAGIEISYASTVGYIQSYDRSTDQNLDLYISGKTIQLNAGGEGNVGIGTTSPGALLHVKGTSTVAQILESTGSNSNVKTQYVNGTITGGELGIDAGGNGTSGGQFYWYEGGYRLTIQHGTGYVGIGTASPGYKLDVNGNTNVSGDITLSGTIHAKYQDVAEWVPTSEQLTSGTVVVLDSTKSNQVISSTQSYDTRVAGVISERPGLAMGEEGKGKVLVATTGRVMVKVDATNGPIHIGDLLVTSDVPGVAMKSEPITIGNRKMHMPGTLIGKALEPLEKGSGKILVLLSLQ